jgi:hypothetical protein
VNVRVVLEELLGRLEAGRPGADDGDAQRLRAAGRRGERARVHARRGRARARTKRLEANHFQLIV